MRLDRLIEQSLVARALDFELRRRADPEITAVTMDSRAVAPGTLFACVPGRTSDGHAFAAEAVGAGAVALLCERPLDLDVAQVIVASTRVVLGPVAAVVYGDPSNDLVVVGVTGTNGKTTTCALLAGIFDAHGWNASALGTLTQARTTPEAPELQQRLASLRADGHRAVAMEVSSHALDQRRIDGVHYAAGVLTNVTRDHLDYHATMERYFEAKAILFDEDHARLAVVNRDDERGRMLLSRLVARGAPVADYGIDDAVGLRMDATESTFTWEGTEVHLRLGGRFNVLNALGAARCAAALGVPAEAVVAGLASVERVPGRFESIRAGQPFTVLVDYAHTPDGLEQALTAARELSAKRLLVVFGAGGERDQEKRPLMGEVTSRLADLAVVTSDNPRGEDPRLIIEAIVAGAHGPGGVQVIEDRAEAITTTLALAGPGDVVVVAGKGHEQGQEVAGQVRHFDDGEVVRAALDRLSSSRRSGGGR